MREWVRGRKERWKREAILFKRKVKKKIVSQVPELLGGQTIGRCPQRSKGQGIKSQ